MKRRIALSIAPCASRRHDGACQRNLEAQTHDGSGARCPLGHVDGETPHWDPDTRRLWLGAELVKQFRQPAPNQETILAALEESRWAWQIDDPLPPEGEIPPKDRLEFTIWRLNRFQKKKLVRFFGDGTGEGDLLVADLQSDWRAIGERLKTRSRSTLEYGLCVALKCAFGVRGCRPAIRLGQLETKRR